MVEECPIEFWQDKKRRTVKSLYTHAIDMIKQASDQNDPLKDTKEQALKIVFKFQEVLSSKEDCQDYAKVVQSSLLALLASDKREQWRHKIIQRFRTKGLSQDEFAILLLRSLDHSRLVRIEFWERLKADYVPLESFREPDLLTLIKNGLSDPDPTVLDTARSYFTQMLSAETPEKFLAKLNLRANWEQLKMTEVLKLLFKEVIQPKLSEKKPLRIDLEQIRSRTDLNDLFEKLVF